MTARIPGKSTINSAQGALHHSRDLLLALSRAGQSIQQARTTDEIYRAVGNQIKSLGGEVTLLMVNDDRQSLTTDYTSYAPSLLRRIEKLIGFSALGYRIVFPPDSVYARSIATGEAEYVHWAKEHVAEALPKAIRPLAVQFMSILKIEQGILVPLHMENEILGLMMVSGLMLTEEDVPAMDSFAGQIAVSLHNVRLTQQMQNELTARKEAEEFLKRSRNLLLALGRAAQSVQQAHTAEEIYQAVGEQIKSIGHDVIILIAGDGGQYLNYTYSTFSKSLIKTGEKLTGLSIQGYRFYTPPESVYGRVLRTGKGGFEHWTGDLIAEALPIALRSMADKLVRLLKIEQSVIAPLCIESEIFGTLTVAGSAVTEADIPAIESFAAQVAISLNNARLAQKAERELSERKQAEEALKQSEARYRLLADHMTDTIWLLDMDLRTTYISPSVEKIRGFTLEQLQELPFDQNLVPASFQLAMEVFAVEIPKVLADPKYLPVLTLELEFFNRDGTIYSTESKLSMIRDENGNPISIMGESRDIAERKHTEKALYDSERYYRALIENATDGILVVNMQGKIRYESPSVARMLGYDPDTLIGTSAFDLINPDDLTQIAGVFMEGLNPPGFVHRGEYRIRHRSGEWRYFEVISRYLMGDPVIAGIIINGRDITDRKQAEDELRRANKSLEATHQELQQMFAHEQVLARTDGLTGLHNRRYFFELATREFNASLRYQRPLTIILFDIDDFKQVNDSFGHALGDTILIQSAQSAASQVRDVDILARYGGDEFIILLPETSAQQAYLIAERIRERVASTRIESENSPFVVTLSIGVAETVHAPQDESVEDPIRRADKALYMAKQKGRNNTVIFTGP